MSEIRPITTEDISGLDLSAQPSEIEINSFLGHPVAELRTAPARGVLADIERAIIDKGWRAGVRSCAITVERIADAKGGHLRMRARIGYGA